MLIYQNILYKICLQTTYWTGPCQPPVTSRSFLRQQRRLFPGHPANYPTISAGRQRRPEEVHSARSQWNRGELGPTGQRNARRYRSRSGPPGRFGRLQQEIGLGGDLMLQGHHSHGRGAGEGRPLGGRGGSQGGSLQGFGGQEENELVCGRYGGQVQGFDGGEFGECVAM